MNHTITRHQGTIRKGPWTREEDAIVRATYESHTSIEAADVLKRSVSAVRNRRMFLGLNTQVRKWSNEEVAVLRDAYAKAPPLNLKSIAAILGRSHTNVCRKARELGLTDQCQVVAGNGGNHGYSRARGGRRADLGEVYFRSSWEANYARYLNWLVRHGKIVGWEYEVKTFVFERISRGTRAYTPDFRVVMSDGRVEWHEVKGWMDPKSRTRLDRMKRYYPNEVVVVIGKTWFQSASRNIAPMIPNWETGREVRRRGEVAA